MTSRTYSVTWDYLCPFARNAHEHLVAALDDGAPWEVTFTPFCLMQAHVEEGDRPVWDLPDKARGLLALEAGVVVRDNFPGRFRAAHVALFSARHDEGKEISDPEVVRATLESVGVPADQVFAEIEKGWPLQTVRAEHEKSVSDYEVFGVPTFIVDDDAVFVRLMTRPRGDGSKARAVIGRVVDLLDEHPEVNEFKHTKIPR
ncbi:MAG TPA: DsbA family protein [Acidimicrobiales bacterium]|nr:DsbA family protein [Acidimicrobiales bacterium]